MIVAGGGKGTVTFNHNQTYDFSTQMEGLLTVNQMGPGTTILSGTSNYGGRTSVMAGRLLVTGSLGRAETEVHAGALLGGNGSLLGKVNVAEAATLAPGTDSEAWADLAVGMLLLGGSASTSLTQLDISGQGNGAGIRGIDYDSITVTDSDGLTYGGTLEMTFWNSQPFADWTVFHLFDHTGTTFEHFGSITTLALFDSIYGGLSFKGPNPNGDWIAEASNGQTLLFSEADGTLSIVPEPSTLLLGSMGIGMAWWLRRKRSGSQNKIPAAGLSHGSAEGSGQGC
jgi:autotransporter-associated beta strand protein